MAYDIIIGRDESDKKKFGERGLIFLGKGYVKMEQYTSLSNNLWLDVARSHVILIAGKRGSGKSYSISVIAEELSSLPEENAKNIASLIFDTMGVFWTMRYKNEKDRELLKAWNLEPKNIPVIVFVPEGRSLEYQKQQIPFDKTFALKPSELESEDWITLFNLDINSLQSVLIQNSVSSLKKKTPDYTIEEIKNEIKIQEAGKETKEITLALFNSAESWGVFSNTRDGTRISDLISAGKTTIVDISVYNSTSAFNVRALVIGIITRKLFQSRMDSRKKEELDSLISGKEYLSFQKRKDPLIWLFVDEIHEFLGKEEKTPATDSLIQVLREGRQPGISLVMATQQPGQLHNDALSQSDIILSHRVTSKADVEALNEIMQTYLLSSIKQQMDDLPSEKGSAIILDDNSERIYSMRIRPKYTWHGGEAPVSIKTDIQI